MSATLKTSKEDLAKLQQEAVKDFAAAKSAKEVNDLRVKYLGDKSVIVNMRRNMKDIPKTFRAITFL